MARTSPIFFQRGGIPASESIVGIGCNLELIGADIVVSNLKEGGSAKSGGLEVGNIILAVDGTSLAGRDLQFARDMIKGKEGTSVSLLVKTGSSLASSDIHTLILLRSRPTKGL